MDLYNKAFAEGEGVVQARLAMNQAQTDFNNAQNKILATERNAEKVSRELKQDRLERNLDILLDDFDNQKTINEKLIADETLTFEVREDLLDKTKKLGSESFDEQIKTIEQFTKVKINAKIIMPIKIYKN